MTDVFPIAMDSYWLSYFILQRGKESVGTIKCNVVAKSPNDDTYGVIVGKRKEGVAILWKTKFDSYIT